MSLTITTPTTALPYGLYSYRPTHMNVEQSLHFGKSDDDVFRVGQRPETSCKRRMNAITIHKRLAPCLLSSLCLAFIPVSLLRYRFSRRLRVKFLHCKRPSRHLQVSLFPPRHLHFPGRLSRKHLPQTIVAQTALRSTHRTCSRR